VGFGASGGCERTVSIGNIASLAEPASTSPPAEPFVAGFFSP
jgi:hypothetical protein